MENQFDFSKIILIKKETDQEESVDCEGMHFQEAENDIEDGDRILEGQKLRGEQRQVAIAQ